MAAAVGLDQTRGDQLVVQTIPFTVAASETGAAPWLERNRDLVRAGIKYGALIVAALILVVFVVRPARKALKLAAAQSAAPALLLPAPPVGATLAAPATHAPYAESLPDAQRREVAAAAAAPALIATAQLPEVTPLAVAGLSTVAELEAQMDARLAQEFVPTDDALRSQAVRQQLVKSSRNEPELIAMTIRGWLREPRAQRVDAPSVGRD